MAEEIEKLCEECESEFAEANVEAWETFGKFLCAECAESAFEEAAARAEWEATKNLPTARDLDDMRDAYDITDPKHPDYAETMLSRADAARKGGF